jgi:hypothetical protein
MSMNLTSKARPRTFAEIREAVDELKQVQAIRPPLPKDKYYLFWEDELPTRPHPEKDSTFIITLPDGTEYSIHLVTFWAEAMSSDCPDEIIGEECQHPAGYHDDAAVLTRPVEDREDQDRDRDREEGEGKRDGDGDGDEPTL